MAFNIVVGGVVRHVTYCQYPGQVATNKRDWQCISLTGGSSINSDDVIANLDGQFAANITNCMTDDAQYYGSQLYYQTPVGAPPRPSYTTVNAGNGVDVANALPLQTSGLVSLYSDQLGKSGQGRIYVPFPAISSMDTNGTPIALYLTQLGILGQSLVTPMTVVAGAITAVFKGVLYKPGGAPPLQLNRYVVRDGWATQRRRGNFGRPNANPF